MGLLSLIRRTQWDLFFYLHTLLALCTFISVALHTTGSFIFYTLPILVYIADLYFRYKDCKNEVHIKQISAQVLTYYSNISI